MAVASAQTASAFAATIAGALDHRPSPLSDPEVDRAVSIARASAKDPGMMLTATEASLVCRYLLYSLNIRS